MPDSVKWQFAARFRRQSFGWRSDAPIQRLKEAVSEIRQVARKDPVLAAQGAILLLEKLTPALAQVDSSSGGMGTAVNRAIATLVPIIGKAVVPASQRAHWLERAWAAFLADDIGYIDLIGDHWGTLCASPELAGQWAEQLTPMVETAWAPVTPRRSYFKGTSACFASLYAAGRHEQLLTLLARAPFRWWHDRRWGVKALVAMGRKAEALQYAEGSAGLNAPLSDIAQACEDILLSSGMAEEAYRRYALQANQVSTNLATFRAIRKKYPTKSGQDILHDLVASTPGAEGKWFAAAKDAGLFALALELASASPTDPRTLTRAARDHVTDQPDFAVAAGLSALHWVAHGVGYDVTSADVLEAYSAIMQAAPACNQGPEAVAGQIQAVAQGELPFSAFVKTALAHQRR